MTQFVFAPRSAASGVFAAAILACAAGAVQAAGKPLEVVASFSILGDMVHQIGGDDVKVTTLVGPDGDAHTYEPKPSDAKRLATAKVLVVNGLSFETWLPALSKSAGYQGPVVVASTGVAARLFEEGGSEDRGQAGAPSEAGHAHRLDPHAWQSLVNGRLYAQNIIAGLASADPAHADAYRQRGGDYLAKIDALQAVAEKTFAAIPAARRQVVTSHDAFGYFGDAYHVKFIPVAGVSTEAEPSAADMARIIEQVKREQVPAVFVENITNPRLAQQIAREAGAKVGGSLYSDALSKPGEPGATYLGMFEWNIRKISEALQP
jgi:zinc/manganese transport system substrate-binding protein